MLGLCLPGLECCDGRDTMAVPGSGGDGSQGAAPQPGGIQGRFRVPLCSILTVLITQEGGMESRFPSCGHRDGGSIQRQSWVLL